MIIGLRINILLFLFTLDSNCFTRNLIASANGWNRPIIKTTLGPKRNCLKPKILRSKRVTNATQIKIGKIIEKNLKTDSNRYIIKNIILICYIYDTLNK